MKNAIRSVIRRIVAWSFNGFNLNGTAIRVEWPRLCSPCHLYKIPIADYRACQEAAIERGPDAADAMAESLLAAIAAEAARRAA